ncbi:hypothetical protein HNP38_002805 [Chryseobacterium defluvii]|uniref:Uncharacterized protein n=1 Tax=Chryseobacterium defluvii TaxID=160396 RepID=A0A840KDA9_9FLAO|nr:hypothetical protein [Chryseobacterium defluvii]MBB4807499.1 hypothetical protein [Chryseobacterium defluvii]
MKNSKLFLLFILFSTLSFAQKKDETRVTITTDKGEKTERTVKKEKTPHFIQFGIMSRNHESFKNKYGVDVVYENCVISPFLSKKAENNNKAVAGYLTEKHGDMWKKDLGIIPYGL